MRRVVHWFNNELIPLATSNTCWSAMVKMETDAECVALVLEQSPFAAFVIFFVLMGDGSKKMCVHNLIRKKSVAVECCVVLQAFVDSPFLLIGKKNPTSSLYDIHVREHIYRKKELFFLYHVNGCVWGTIYLPHSVAFCNGHSEAVAMNPWRRLSTRVLWSSPLQHGTIVPVPWVNGVVFVSFVPISVPVDV